MVLPTEVTVPRDRDGDRTQRNWRDVDRNKDRSKHRQPERRGPAPHAKARADSASKVYRSKLDSFFAGEAKAPDHVKSQLAGLEPTSPEGKKRLAALEKIKDAGTSSEADRAVNAYLEQWELPPDHDILSAVLMCSDEECLEEALDKIAELLEANQAPRRADLLEQRLRRVRALADDPGVAERARHVLERLRLHR